MTQPLLETHGLTRHFGGIHAVDDVSLAVQTGEIRALIGPNGAGKTTLVSLLSGRIEASAGRVVFAGEDITALVAHKRMSKGMAYTFQITSVFGNLTAFENVALAVQRRLGGRGPALEVETHAALARVGLGAHTQAIAGDMAYGHQRLLEIAMGLSQQPRLLILDEPTQGLAAGEIDAFVALIRDLAATATILLIEHNMDVVMALADQITVLDQGRIIAEGTPEAIRDNAAVQDAYLGR